MKNNLLVYFTQKLTFSTKFSNALHLFSPEKFNPLANECRHRGGKNKNNSRLLLELKLKNCRFLKITTQKLTNFIRIAVFFELQLKNCRILLELQLKHCRILQKYK